MDKGNVLAGCKHLFGKWGVHRVTIDHVASHLGISKKTLYKIYSSKDAIVTDFVSGLLEESKLELKSQILLEERLTIRLSSFNRFIVNQALAWGAVLFHDIRKYHPSAYQLIRQHKREMIIFLNDLLVEGQRSGTFRNNFDPMLSAELRINVLEWDIMEVDHNTESIKSKQNQFFDLMFNGLQQIRI